MKVEPDHVYLIAPGEGLVLDQGTLRSRRLPAQARVSIDLIDRFFNSLAADRGPQAIANQSLPKNTAPVKLKPLCLIYRIGVFNGSACSTNNA